MPWRPRAKPLTLAAVVLALAWTVFIARLHVQGLASPIDRFEEVCVDLRYLLVPGKAPHHDVVLVAIDDETVRQAGAFPFPRTKLAEIIRSVARQKPRAIAVDYLFLDSGSPEGDAALADALRSAPAVIAAAGLFRDGESKDSPLVGSMTLPRPRQILWPVQPIAGAADAGLVNLSTGFGGTPRHVPLLFQGDRGVVPSFVLIVAAVATGSTPTFNKGFVSLGARHVPLDLGQQLALRYYPRGAIETVSANSAGGAEPPDLSGRVVVIGATAVGGGDTFQTPFSAVVPGAEVLATAIQNLLAGDALVRNQSTRWIDALAAAGLAVAAVLLIATRRSMVGLALVVLLALLWGGAAIVAFSAGIWLSMALPVAAMAPVAMFYGSARLIEERRRATRLANVERGLRPFQPRPMSDLLSRDPGFLAEPQMQEAAVLFVDLSDYTGLSETVDAMRMRDLLKSFHALVDEIVDRRDGFVVTFMGDGAMVLFGFPQARPDDAGRALGALVELDQALQSWGRRQAGVGGPVQARLSAHCGPVVVSRLGGESHQQITATGDCVNVASRLLHVAKEAHVSMAISDRIFEAAGDAAPRAFFPNVTDVAIRGRTQPVTVRLPDPIVLLPR